MHWHFDCPISVGCATQVVSNYEQSSKEGITNTTMNIESGEWPTPFPKELIDMCYNVALYDSESRNEEDQWDQKELWIKMHEATELCDPLAFREGLKADAFIHHDGVTHKCMTFLQEASKKVDKKLGIWRLWHDSQTIARASERLPKNLSKVKKN